MNNYVFWEGCKVVFKLCVIGFLTWLIKTETDAIIENQNKIMDNQIEIAKMYAKDHNFEIHDREELKNGQAED